MSSIGNMGEATVAADETQENNQSRGRKRERREHTWGKNVRKQKRAAGEEYTNTRGHLVQAKVFVPTVCSCRRKCSEHIPPPIQKDIHDSFYKLGSWDSQTVWLCGAVTIKSPKRPRKRMQNKPASRKTRSRQFILNNKPVCKNFLLRLLQISNHRLDYALRVKQSDGTHIPSPDRRGRKVPGNKVKEEKIEWIREHIKSFPTYRSHYGERSSSRQYLAPNLNVSKMYALFVDKCRGENKEILKQSLYEKVFRTEFNIHFYIPKKDTCKICDELHITLSAETDIERCLEIRQTLDTHTKLAAKGRELLNSYKQDSLKDGSTDVLITFDLERTLPLPHLNTGEVYYLRQLNMLNFGIHTYQHDGEKVVMNMWHETTGARGSQEVTSCLYHYMKHQLPQQTSNLNLFSDCCGGQNRNWNMMFFAMYMVNNLPHVNEICVHYLVTGHTYLPNDGDFSFISRAQHKQSHIFTPNEWMELVQNCRKQSPYIVHNMVGKFVSFDRLNQIFKNYHALVGDGVMVSKIRKAQFVKGQSVMHYNDDYTDIYKSVDLKQRSVSLQSFIDSLQSSTPDVASIDILLTHKKMQDLKKLLKFVPPVHHPFYLSLPHHNRRSITVNEAEDVLPAHRGDQ